MKKWNKKQIDLYLDLQKQGCSNLEIAKKMGTNTNYLYKNVAILRKAGYDKNLLYNRPHLVNDKNDKKAAVIPAKSSNPSPNSSKNKTAINLIRMMEGQGFELLDMGFNCGDRAVRIGVK